MTNHAQLSICFGTFVKNVSGWLLCVLEISAPNTSRIPLVVGNTPERYDFLLARLFVLLHPPPKDKDRDDLGPSVRLDPPLLLLLLGVLQGEAVAGEGLEHLEVWLAYLERKRCTPGQMINTRTRWSTQHLKRWSTQWQMINTRTRWCGTK